MKPLCAQNILSWLTVPAPQTATAQGVGTLAGIVDGHSDLKKFLILITVILLASCSTDNKTKMTEEELNKIFARDSGDTMKDQLVKLDRDSVKKEYGDKFNDLRTIINKHDPIGLISNGAPDDEYEHEVKTIIVQLDNKKTEQQIHDLVYQEFMRWFDDEATAGPKDAYKDLAIDIFVWTKKTTTR